MLKTYNYSIYFKTIWVFLSLSIYSTLLTAQTLYDVDWVDQVNVYYNTSLKTLTNTGTSNWGTSGAASSNFIISNTNGYLYYEVANTSDVQFGLSFNNPDPGTSSIKFSFRLEGGNIFIYIQGSMIGYFGTFSTGYRLQIERSGTNILFKINGSTVYGVSYGSAGSLIADVALKNGGSVLGLIQMTVAPPAPPPPTPIETIYHQLTDNPDGSYYIVSDNTLRLIFVDKYKINSGYSFKIYSTNPKVALKTNADYSGLTKNIGDNRIELSISSLSAGLYTFEIKDDKGLKKYLKFKKV
jgi:hypothetical protein